MQTKLVLAGAVGLALATTCAARKIIGDDEPVTARSPASKDTSDATSNRRRPPRRDEDGGLPAAVAANRLDTIALLRSSRIGAELLDFASRADTQIIYLPNAEYDSVAWRAGTFGVEDNNVVYLPYRTLRDARDGALTLGHELSHAYQEVNGVFSATPDRPARSAPWAPPAVRPLRDRPRGVDQHEFEGLQMEAQAYISEARIADELGILKYDQPQSWAITRAGRIRSMQETVTALARSAQYGEWYERASRTAGHSHSSAPRPQT